MTIRPLIPLCAFHNLLMLLLMRLLNISLDHADHCPVRLNSHVLLKHPATLAPFLRNPPLAPYLQQTQWWMRGDLRVGAIVAVGDGKLIRGLANGLAVDNTIFGGHLCVAFNEFVGFNRRR